MKKARLILLSFITLFSTGIAIAQEYKTDIETEFNEYLNAIISKDFEKSMDYVSDDFFEIFPRDQMVSIMEQTFNNPEVTFELTNPKILRIQDAEHIDKKYYALLFYSNFMSMKFNNMEEVSGEEKESRTTAIKTSLEQNFGSENVSYSKETGTFNVYIEKEAYAISKDGKSEWKFLVVEKQQKPILEKLLPKVLTDKI